MARFESGSSDVRNYNSANCATTTARDIEGFVASCYII